MSYKKRHRWLGTDGYVSLCILSSFFTILWVCEDPETAMARTSYPLGNDDGDGYTYIFTHSFLPFSLVPRGRGHAFSFSILSCQLSHYHSLLFTFSYISKIITHSHFDLPFCLYSWKSLLPFESFRLFSKISSETGRCFTWTETSSFSELWSL